MGRNIDAAQGVTAEMNHIDREVGSAEPKAGSSASGSVTRSFERVALPRAATSFCKPNGDVTSNVALVVAQRIGAWAAVCHSGNLAAVQGCHEDRRARQLRSQTHAFLARTPSWLVATINHERMPVC